jgi:hypothetical protein
MFCNIRRRRISLDGDKYMILLALFRIVQRIIYDSTFDRRRRFRGCRAIKVRRTASASARARGSCVCVCAFGYFLTMTGCVRLYVLCRNITTCTPCSTRTTIIYFILDVLRVVFYIRFNSIQKPF